MAISTLSRSSSSRHSAAISFHSQLTDYCRSSRSNIYNTDSSRIFQLSPLQGGLPRSEVHAVENEVATYLLLRKAGLPVPCVVDLSRSKKTSRILSATLSRPDGVTLLSAIISFAKFQREKIDSQVEYARQILTEQQSATFGDVAAVALGHGLKAWSLAFVVMLETLLEDGEDHFVNLPYAEIRQLAVRSRAVLDDCTQAKLVVPTFGDASCVFVDVDTSNVTGFVGCQDAYWGDPGLVDQNTRTPAYRCYQAVRIIIAKHLRPSTCIGADILEARTNLTEALAMRYSN